MLFGVVLFSCIESFDTTFVDFESVLVVEAIITDIPKFQKINVSRSYEFNAEPIPELNANVSVVDSDGNIYLFADSGNGSYISMESFGVEQGIQYQLLLSTSDGNRYRSDAEQLQVGNAKILNVDAKRMVNEKGEDGIVILVDSFDPMGNSKNYRFEYEETYHIIAPLWSPLELAPVNDEGCEMRLVPNISNEQNCFPTSLSKDILLTSTEYLSQDRVENFQIRFINRNDYIISHRYSILVRQLIQSDQAFEFYNILLELSSSESLLSQVQPGFLQGNIFSVDNSEEHVLGLFDLNTIDEERIFFNYNDFYPEEELPPFLDPCIGTAPPIESANRCLVRTLIESGAGIYAGSSGPDLVPGPYRIVPRICGDCKVLGPAEPPNFWIEG
ncbi:DUF4249 family protein [Muricauda sp. JGD-17]|uniref:DUF4249 family protein n=2 Tax=Flagellimonas ochracea TaxID=2696472 RepID=A0A964WWH9_9FLAO|nr:DUF4249 family protein [Allomuricauda ochracea]